MAKSRDKTDEVMDSSALCEGKSGPSFLKNFCTGVEPIQCQNNSERSEVASALDEETCS